jgi:hypothetical protein
MVNDLKTPRLYALMHQENGEWKIAHRIKNSYSLYSSPISHSPLVFDTLKKARKALEPTGVGNYVPEGTVIFELTGQLWTEK